MLSFFRKNSFFNSLLLLVYAIILQIIPAFMNPPAPDGGTTMWSRILGHIGLIILLFVQAIFLNRLVIENRLHRDIMLFPGVFFILYASALPDFWHYNHIHIANLMVIWSIYELFQIYKTTNPAANIFNAALLISIASIFCPPMIWYLLMLFVGVSNLKKMEVVHPIQILIGAATPWFLWITYSYWQGQEQHLWPDFKEHIGLNVLQILSDRKDIWTYAGFILLVVMQFLLYNEFRKKKHIQAQKKIDILYVGLLFTILVMIFHIPATTEILLIAAPMLGIFIGLFFSHFKNHSIPEMIHFILFIGVLVTQIFLYFNFN